MEDVEAQLLERINESPWYESTDVDNKAILLVFVRYIFQEDVHEDLSSCRETSPGLPLTLHYGELIL